jgi:hypothetical protein
MTPTAERLRRNLGIAVKLLLETLLLLGFATLFPLGLVLLIYLIFRSGWIAPLKPPFIDPAIVFSAWVTGVLVALFTKRVLGEGSQDRPKLVLDKTIGDTVNFVGVLVRNKGQLAANECEARINFTKPVDDAEFTRVRWTDDSVRVQIRPDESEPIRLMWIIREEQRITRIVIPTDKGLELPLSMTKRQYYRGTIKITAANCKAVHRTFKLREKETGGVKLTLD